MSGKGSKDVEAIRERNEEILRHAQGGLSRMETMEMEADLQTAKQLHHQLQEMLAQTEAEANCSSPGPAHPKAERSGGVRRKPVVGSVEAEDERLRERIKNMKPSADLSREVAEKDYKKHLKDVAVRRNYHAPKGNLKLPKTSRAPM